MRLAVSLCATLCLLSLAGPAYAAAADDAPKAKGSSHKITQSTSYLQLPDPPGVLNISFLENGRPVGLLTIALGIDVPDPELRTEADHAMPVLLDAYVRNMMNYASTSIRSWRQPNVVEIADRLQAVTDRALGRPGARVLLVDVRISLK